MKKIAIFLLMISFIFTGCTVNLPFNNRLEYSSIKQLKQDVQHTNISVNIQWIPANFVDRIDFQGASGFVGAGTNTRIPTGVALSQRIEEAVSVIADITNDGMPLIIEVENAQSEFEYSAGIFNITPAIDVADVVFKATFHVKGKEWTNEFKSSLTDPTIGGTSQTGLLEQAWDDIAIQVAKDIAFHLRQILFNN